MPEMPLLDRRGKPFGPIQTWVILSGIMLSPSDQESQLSYQALCQVPPSRLSGNAISKFYKGSIGGSISGEIFICLLQLAIHRDLLPLKRGRRQEPSIAKAVSIVSRELEGQHHDGRLMPSNCDRVHNFWVKFHSVAHIWAAYQLIKASGWEMTPSSERKMGKLNKFILLAADALLSEATAAGLHFPDSWTLPEAYPGKPATFVDCFPPPSSSRLETLKNYQAPARPKVDPPTENAACVERAD